MSLVTTRAQFIRSRMMHIALIDGVEKGVAFFNEAYDFISLVDKGSGNISPDAITEENEGPLIVYSRAVAAWVEYAEKRRAELMEKVFKEKEGV